MGFDIECIIDIHTYPGEYFCPVCRTLVYPNEAFQSQCTHLYCKPCLAHIANGSRACPYDGYLVTESDSKPLIDSDKALSENIGKVKVHCLYFRSGCTWEGTLSECTSHCSGCLFGNSPVICNKCGIQIVHRQVHEHALSCSGAYEGQNAVGGVSSLTRSDTISFTAEMNPQSGAPPSQAQNSQDGTSRQNSNLQVSGAQVVAPVSAPTPEQWYQQQYQQYYQQYDPYQQANQQYYQHQPLQVEGQQQTNHVPQAPQQPHIPPQAQWQAQSQPQTQLHQAHPHVPVLPQGHAPNQGLVLPNYQVNSQQQAHPPVRPPQTLPPPPQSHPTQPPTYAQAMGMQPLAQHPQVPQYQQPHVQMMHPQASQPQMQSQAQAQLPQSSNQLHGQIQTQAQPYHTQPQPPIFPVNQSAHATLPQAPQQQVPPLSGHHSYSHPPQPHKMYPGQGVSQTHPMHPQMASGSLHPVQVPQQHALMRPPTHGSVPHQHPSTLLASQNQTHGVTPAPQSQFPPHAPQSAYPHQNRPVVQPAQQALSQSYAQEQHFLTPYESQIHQQGHLSQQQSMPTMMRPLGPPAEQSQNFIGRPMLRNQGPHSQNHPFSSGNFGTPAPQFPPPQTSVNQSYAKSNVPEQNATSQETRSPSKGLVKKIGEPLVGEEFVAGQNGTVVKNPDSDASVNKSIKQDENHVQRAMEQASSGKSLKDGAAEAEFHKEQKLLADSDSLKQVDLENQNLVTGSSSTTFDKQSHIAVPASGSEGHILRPHSHGFHQQAPQAQAPGQPPSMPQSQGIGISHRPGSHNLADERMPGYFGPPKSFESQSGPQGPAPTTFADQCGVEQSENNQMSRSGNLLGAAEGDEKMVLSKELLNTFPREPVRNHDQASRFFDKAAPHGPTHDPQSKNFPHHPSAHSHAAVFGPGPDSQHQTKHFSRRTPDRDPYGFRGPSSFPRSTKDFIDIKSREAHRFGEDPQSFNFSSGPDGNPFRDGRFPTMPDHLRRGDLDRPRNPRFGEPMVRGPHHNQFGRGDVFATDGPGHLLRGEFSGPGYLPGHFYRNEPSAPVAFPGPGNFPHRPLSGSVRGDGPSFSHYGEPPMMNSYSRPGFQTSANFSGGMEFFDQSRKRKSVSYGWCRVCEMDCESVEGLDLHSQTREHQKMAMDIVKSIKLQNIQQHRNSAGFMMNEGGRSRKMSILGHGSKP